MSTFFLDPNGDDSPLGWITSTGTDHYVLVDDGTRQPTAANTTDHVNRQSMGNGSTATDVYTMSTSTLVGTATQLKVWIYARRTGGMSTGEIYAAIDTGGGVGSFTAFVTALGAFDAWYSATFTGTWNQAAIDALKVHIKCTTLSGVGQQNYWNYETYVEGTDDDTPVGGSTAKFFRMFR